MSREILEKVKSFLVQLVKDESFRNQLMSEKVEDVKKIMADRGYQFSHDEFETAAIQILELKELGQFQDLTEDELVGAIGGLAVSDFSESPIVQPMYGIPIYKYKPPVMVPHYGVIMPVEVEEVSLEVEETISDQPEH